MFNKNFIGALLIGTVSFNLGAQDLPKASPDRMQSRIEKLSEYGRNSDGGVDRVAYSKADIEGRVYIMSLMRSQGLENIRIDVGGNIIGRRSGSDPNAKPIMVGSHIDSVPGGGNYDGDVGVIANLEVIDLMNASNIRTKSPVDVVVFSNEEGGLVGSLAMTGKLKPETLDVMSHSGLTIGEGTRAIGGDPDNILDDAIAPGILKAFIELHIEQGAFLDEEDIDIGVVEGIVGINWWDITIQGVANHGGTTPMNRRQDAMVAAAHLTLAINEIANELEGRQVATVGRIQAFPGAPNVIPGKVVMSLEVRDLEQEKMDRVFSLVEARAKDIARKTGTTINFEFIDVASHPAPTDKRMRSIIAKAAKEAGYSYKLMPSGAGHDAQDMVSIAPTGMIFVPSKGGISHSPKEYTSPDEMAKGADVLLRAILEIDKQKLD
ncbi:Zn-dependent hydrolase [Alteromonadaceae bacterium M269]|nr:Zn-dependent hydrolase [Alteromonadaceae bacterium M269]